MIAFLLSIQIALFSQSAYANLEFDDLSSSDIDAINRDISALMAHTTLSPPSGLLVVGGFEFGLIGGTVTVPNIEKLVAEQDPDNATPKLPNAGLILVYSYAERVTFEAKWIPDIGSRTEGLSLGSQSVAMKISSAKNKEPFTRAVRLDLTNAYMRTQQEVNNASTGNIDVTLQMKYTSLSLGGTYLMGYKWVGVDSIVVEPYFGAGLVYATSKIATKASAAASIFGSGSSSAKSSQTGAMLAVGFQVHAYFSKFAVEYGRVFDSDKVTAKISFGY